MTDQEFRDRVLDELAAVRADLAANNVMIEHLCDMRKTLYGEDGTGGLVEEVRKLKFRFGLFGSLVGLATAIGAGLIAHLKGGK